MGRTAKEKIEKIDYPRTDSDPKFESVPDDWDTAKHNPLKKKDFEKEEVYFYMRADQLEAAAQKMRRKGEYSAKFGSSKDAVKAKRLKKMQEKMAELQKQLEADGVDVEALLSMQADD